MGGKHHVEKWNFTAQFSCILFVVYNCAHISVCCWNRLCNNVVMMIKSYGYTDKITV